MAKPSKAAKPKVKGSTSDGHMVANKMSKSSDKQPKKMGKKGY